MSKYRVIFVDDEEDIRDIARLLLESAGIEVVCFEEAKDALKALEESAFDLILTDMLMPEMDGVELITEIRRKYPEQPILAISGGGHAPKESYLQIARLYGVQEVLAKPFNREQLLTAVAHCGGPGPSD